MDDVICVPDAGGVDLIRISPSGPDGLQKLCSHPWVLLLLVLVLVLYVLLRRIIWWRKRVQYRVVDLWIVASIGGLLAYAGYCCVTRPPLPARNFRLPSYEYSISRYEITNDQYASVLGLGSSTAEDGRLPVTNITRTDAEDFCKRLSESCGRIVRLPTASEWLYACGMSSDDNIAVSDWCTLNSSGRKQPVGLRSANAFGLYDMFGNVSEFVVEPEAAEDVVAYGGSFATPPVCYVRFRFPKDVSRNREVGFRVVVEIRGTSVKDQRPAPPSASK